MQDAVPGTATVPLSAAQRATCLAAILTSNFSFGLAFGGLAPLMSLTLEGRGVHEALIGLNSSMAALGVLTMASFTPRLVHRYGVPPVLFGFSALLVGAVALLPLMISVPTWLMLRYVIGIGIAAPWIITETWMNEITPARIRGRVIALYGTVLAGGFAAGPLLLTLVGTEGVLPFYYCMGVIAAGLMPLALVRRLAPSLRLAEKTPMKGMLLAAPSVFGAAIVAGALDTTVFSLMPVWGLRAGLEETRAVTALSFFVAGNLLLQVPIGWLSDHWGRRRAMLLCGTVAFLGPAAVILLTGTWLPLIAVMFVWGGFGWALYTVGLSMLGERYRAGALTAANATFIMAFELANVVVPPAAGFAMTVWEPHGLPAFMGLIALVFTVLVAVRGLVRGGEPAPRRDEVP